MKKILWFSLLSILVLLLNGCATYKEISENEYIDRGLKQYAKTARWGELESLYGFVKPDDIANVVPAENLHNIKVTDYQVQSPATRIGVVEEGEETNEITLVQTAVIEYILKDSQVVHTLTDNQVWEYHRDTKSLFRINPVPIFK